MKIMLECVPCFVRQAAEAIDMTSLNPARRDWLMRRILRDIADADWAAMPVTLSQLIQRRIRGEPGCGDPYRLLKDRMNRMALDLLPILKNAAQQQPDPQEAVVRLAIAGNLLDAGSKTRLSPEELPAHLQTVWNQPMTGSASDLFRAAENAQRIVYLADNAGEIVFDRLLIETLPAGKVTVAVRGSPVLNDATMEDADTAGIPAIAPVIANGSDAPGTILAECSSEFRNAYHRADLIISKGQGNYETLSTSDKTVFFLLSVKCPSIAAEIGAPVGSLVVKRGRSGDARVRQPK